MRTFMIVDDENWIRTGILQLIAAQSLNLELVGEAGDGEEAYAMVLENRPDILLLDMRMPGWDGKQLLRKLNEQIPELITIVISGYSDFEYTKEAINYSAFDYLLKPVNGDELKAVLDKALVKLDMREAVEKREGRNAQAEWMKHALFHASTKTEIKQELHSIEWGTSSFIVCVGQSDFYVQNKVKVPMIATIQANYSITQLKHATPQFLMETLDSPENEHEIIMIYHGKGLNPSHVKCFMEAMLIEFQQSSSLSYSFGISKKIEESYGLQGAYHQAKKFLKNKLLNTSGQLLNNALDYVKLSFPYPHDKERIFLHALQSGNKQAIGIELDHFFADLQEADVTVEGMQQISMLLIHAIEKMLNSLDTGLEEVCGYNSLSLADKLQHAYDIQSVRRLMDQMIISELSALFQDSCSKHGEKLIREVLKLLKTQYFRSLTLIEVANSYHLNPDYLSRLFKKVVGQNFVDYMTDLRIKKSKELMLTTPYKNYEIAAMVGYEDYRYFSQVFKKKIGMTIGEYRNRAINKGEDE
jgi:two-component system response regulator YesN